MVYDMHSRLIHLNDKVTYHGKTWKITRIEGNRVTLLRSGTVVVTTGSKVSKTI